MNYSNLTMNMYDNALYNPSCINEMEKYSNLCEDFKVDVTQTLGDKFKIIVIINSLFVLYKLYIAYSKPKFSQSNFYIKYIAFRIDFIQVIISLISVAYLFL